jgi:hypothetical protein
MTLQLRVWLLESIRMQHFREGLHKVIAEALRRAPADQIPLLAWPIVSGAAVAARTRALGFQGGVLHIEVPDAAWRAQLQGFAVHYAGRINQLTAVKVEQIEFILARTNEAKR